MGNSDKSHIALTVIQIHVYERIRRFYMQKCRMVAQKQQLPRQHTNTSSSMSLALRMNLI
jgi:hypothetical protein